MPKGTVAIIGGGAAGLCGAIQLARAGATGIVVLEKGPRVGKKLMATGNGTCNITNRELSLSHFHGQDAGFAAPALTRFGYADTLAFFRSIGVDCVTEPDGRTYPRSRQAGSVLDCLRLTAEALGVQILPSSPVTAIQKSKTGFLLTTPTGKLSADKVMIAVGGAASPSLGGGNDGYTLLTALGHCRTPLFPTIVQLKTDTTYVKAVKGMRVEGRLTLQTGKQALTSEGEILFTEYGLSGPATMAISRLAGDWERQKKAPLVAHLDILPDIGLEELTSLLKNRCSLPGRDCAEYLTGFLNKRVGQTVMRMAGISLTSPLSALTEGDIARIAALCKDWAISVTGTGGFANAQATAGGIATRDFDPDTMQSRLIPGLYAVGEVLDIDGDCGGYNLQWAWASATAAAMAIGKKV